MIRQTLLSGIMLGLCACQTSTETRVSSTHTLPVAVSNHAVAQVRYLADDWWFIFNGLNAGKTWQDISNSGFYFHQGRWHSLAMPAQVKPVLASVAIGVKSSVYLIGGYTVAEDHTEVSTPYIYRLDVPDLSWHLETTMPTPVDDTVVVNYQERYLYLISGWHDTDNVNLVQVYDLQTKTWKQATPFPLPAVFGHAGGIIDNRIVICDGVKVVYVGEKKSFEPSPACAVGEINTEDVTQINWSVIDHYSGVANYRMAARSDAELGIVFAGGSDNPYNYNGVGYNGIPSKASGDIRIYDVNNDNWRIIRDHTKATMDHRGLLQSDGYFHILGGMHDPQTVSDEVVSFSLVK
ncbi:Kelch repeat-containing protein [Marinicella sp. W31]|uniref:Kelch repeat-containing protein n=1 Tax=Marinicella sp. W31 TaxID=3023713 RepID=UPI003756F3EB